jgi:hypothetical protein
LHVLAGGRLAYTTVNCPLAHAPGGRYLFEKSQFLKAHGDTVT